MNSDVKKIWFIVALVIVIIAGTLYYGASRGRSANVATTTPSNTGGVVFSNGAPSGFPDGLIPASAATPQFSQTVDSTGVIFSLPQPLPKSATDYIASLSAAGWNATQIQSGTTAASFSLTNPENTWHVQVKMSPLPNQATVVMITIMHS